MPASVPLIPKFASEVTAMVCELRNRDTSSLLAFLRRPIDRLANALERERIGGLGAAGGGGLDHHVGALAHGVEQLGLFRRVLDPGAVVLGVHREVRAADSDA